VLRIDSKLSALTVEAACVKDALSAIKAENQALKDIELANYSIFLNGKNINGKLKKKLKDGDEIAIISPIAGG
jgi:molybdopterin converting factor small subunit